MSRFDAPMNALFRQLLGLAPADPADPRPPIDFGDPEQLRRDDLSREERHALKSSTFLQRYGAPTSFPDLEAMKALSLEDAQALVEQFNRTYGCAGMFKRAMAELGPAPVLDGLERLYPEPQAVPEVQGLEGPLVPDVGGPVHHGSFRMAEVSPTQAERDLRRHQAMNETFIQCYGGKTPAEPEASPEDPDDPEMVINPKFDVDLLREQLEHKRTSTGRAESEPELQFVPIPQGIQGLKDMAQAWLDTGRAVAEATGAADPNKNLVECPDLDYSDLELRVAAQAEPMRNLAIQALAAGEQMEGRMAELKERLAAFATEHRLTLTGLDDQQINVGMPADLSLAEQADLAEELAAMMQEPAVPVAPPVRRGSVLAPGHARAPMALGAMMSMLGVGLPEPGRPEHETARLRPANPGNGEFGRVGPDLVVRLRQSGFNVPAGNMLKWFPIEGQEPGIFACNLVGGGMAQGPIPLALLPKKVQKRAHAARVKFGV